VLPPCIYGQLDAAAVAFLMQHIGEEEVQCMAQMPAPRHYQFSRKSKGSDDHVLALLERYTLEVLREQVEEGVLDFEHAHHPRHQRFAWHLRDVLICKGNLPQGTWTKSQK
jgi:hypothetical protein